MRVRFAGIAWIALLAGAVLAAGARAAWAHGGAFGPPPPPREQGPPGGGGGPPTHVDPGFGGPIVTPAGGGAVTPRRASKRKTPITPTLETSWQLWWSLQRDEWLPTRRLVGGAAAIPITPSPGRNAEGWSAQRHRWVESRVVPALLALIAPDAGQPDDVVASAALALGKLALDDAAIEPLFALVLDARRDALVRESAALALGLLRRSTTAQRLSTPSLEGVRARLLQVFDGFVDGKRVDMPLRTRAFAMYAIALLGDQPFHDQAVTRDGRLISKLLWERLAVPYPDRELHIALLTALGRQPRAGLPDGVVEGLRAIVHGGKVLSHRWDVLKRAHAVTAVARLGGPSANALLLRIVSDARRNVVLRLSAALALADRAPDLAAAERSATLRVMGRAFVLEQELLGVGLANIAYGRMVGADLAAGSTRALDIDDADRLLLERAEKAPAYVRGFALLGLAVAAREARGAQPRVRTFRARAAALLQRLAHDREPPAVQGAALVGLGLLADPAVAPLLIRRAMDAAGDVEVRAHAALAVGQVGAPGGAVEALGTLVTTASTPTLVRGHAALALALSGGAHAAGALIERLGEDAPTRRQAALASALGRLGHLGAIEPLLDAARRAELRPLTRAMALVALGRLLDPEPRPSLLRLTRGACYPARSKALQEIFTIL